MHINIIDSESRIGLEMESSLGKSEIHIDENMNY